MLLSVHKELWLHFSLYFHGRVNKDKFTDRKRKPLCIDRKPFWGKNYCFLKPRMFLVVEFLHQEPEDRLLQPTSRGPAGLERLLCGASAQQVPRYSCMVVGSTEGLHKLVYSGNWFWCGKGLLVSWWNLELRVFSFFLQVSGHAASPAPKGSDCPVFVSQAGRRRNTATSWAVTVSPGSWPRGRWPACRGARRAGWPLHR